MESWIRASIIKREPRDVRPIELCVREWYLVLYSEFGLDDLDTLLMRRTVTVACMISHVPWWGFAATERSVDMSLGLGHMWIWHANTDTYDVLFGVAYRTTGNNLHANGHLEC